jgi:hypothetical protein
VTPDTPPKTKRSRNSSSTKLPRSSAGSRKKQAVHAKKITVCLALFLFSFFSAGLLSFVVTAPIKPPYDMLTLQLHPNDHCPSVAQDAATKMDVRESLQRDSWYFVPAYALLFVALGLAVFSSRQPLWIYGLGIVLLAIFAAGSDLLENHYLESCIDGNYIAAGLARRWSLSKWEFLSFTTVAAAPPFLARSDWTQKIGYVLAAPGIPGLLLVVPLDFAYPIVHYALLPLFGLGLGLMALTFVGDLMNPSFQRVHWQ